jgi:hypothetical protein
MFNKVNPWPRINAFNFAINERCYDVSNQRTMYSQTSAQNTNWQTTAKVNMDTALGMPSVH